MACNHEKLRCTDGIYYCLVCGQRIDIPAAEDKTPEAENKPKETAKKAVKRKTKKEAE